ncbi:MAG: clostripain-related cysteine peptidase [Bacteroidota bacterium]|nr:clostripain-related cysteine peptidase [Bacteroidota bacterium]
MSSLFISTFMHLIQNMKKYLFFLIFCLALASCSSIPSKFESFQSKGNIKYSIIYLIHGDGSYLYHDSSGNQINADERMLHQAQLVAEHSPESEVFIFHIKPKEHFLFFFPLKDRELFHYQNGKLITSMTYNTEESYSNLELESRYYKRYTLDNYMNPKAGAIKKLFLFYGHQIPEFGGNGYNSSYPDMAFNLDNFIAGLSQFRMYSEDKFDLVVLSTCNNGTPGVISKLSPLARYAIASPEDLHLSYISSLPILELNKALQNHPFEEFVKQFAQKGFDELTRLTQTIVTVSVYDMNKVTVFLSNVKESYRKLINQTENRAQNQIICDDCIKNGQLNMTNSDYGVIVFYRPPIFGRSKALSSHSGWGCPQSSRANPQ